MSFFTKDKIVEITEALQAAYDEYSDSDRFPIQDNTIASRVNLYSNKLRLTMGKFNNNVELVFEVSENSNYKGLIVIRTCRVENKFGYGGFLTIKINPDINDVKPEEINYEYMRPLFANCFDRMLEMRTGENAEIVKAIYKRYRAIYDCGYIPDIEHMFVIVVNYYIETKKRYKEIQINIEAEIHPNKERREDSHMGTWRVKLEETMLNNEFDKAYGFVDELINKENLELYSNPNEYYIDKIIERIGY